MDELFSIVNALTPAELKLASHFFKLKKYGEQKKRTILFEIILNKKNKDEKQVAKMLGYSNQASAFKNLKVRLKSDLLSILLMQECSSKYTTPYAQAMFSCKRSLMQGEILMSRGIYEEAIDILNKASKLAIKFELFGEQLLIEDLVRNNLALRNKSSALAEVSSSINESYSRLGQLLEIKQKHYEISIPGFQSFNSFDQYLEKGTEIMNEISKMGNMSNSSRVKLFHDLASLHFFSSIHDFESAEKHATRLLKAVETDIVVMSKTNQAGANMELANIYLNVGKFEKAILYASNAVELFKPGMINQLQSYIILFFSYFRNDDMKNASKIIEVACENRFIKNHQNSVLASRLHFLRAGVAFKQQDYDMCSAILRENAKLLEDKNGWMPGYFLLDLLILIEKHDIDLASFRIEAFRKLLRRHNLDKKEFRLWEITSLLRHLLRENCEYPKLFLKQSETINLLSEAKGKYYWNPAGYEVIRFDHWLTNKEKMSLHCRLPAISEQ